MDGGTAVQAVSGDNPNSFGFYQIGQSKNYFEANVRVGGGSGGGYSNKLDVFGKDNVDGIGGTAIRGRAGRVERGHHPLLLGTDEICRSSPGTDYLL